MHSLFYTVCYAQNTMVRLSRTVHVCLYICAILHLDAHAQSYMCLANRKVHHWFQCVANRAHARSNGIGLAGKSASATSCNKYIQYLVVYPYLKGASRYCRSLWKLRGHCKYEKMLWVIVIVCLVRCRLPYLYVVWTLTWNMHGTMAVVDDGIDVRNYCLVAISVSVCSDRLSTMPPRPGEHFVNESKHEYWGIERISNFVKANLTLRTNSSACSAALCANAPRSISSDNTPALSTSVICACIKMEKNIRCDSICDTKLRV